MKRYLLFVYAFYYPCGGWNDLAGAYETIDEAQSAKKLLDLSYGRDYHIVDTDSLQIIEGDKL